jgi:HprK-related kinase A
MSTLADAGAPAVAAALRGDGLWLDVGAVLIHLRSDVPLLAAAVADLYRHFPLQTSGPWADLHVEVRSRRRLHVPWRPQVEFVSDGTRPFEPFPADTPLPMFEWGANWLIGLRTHHRLLLHAGTLARDDLALVMPAVPGAGKSTLTAALALSGWRLLSDEFGVVDMEQGLVWPLIKPPVLKNRSIDVIRRFAPGAVIGRVYPATRKGDVAHVAPPADAVAARHRPARPFAIVLPHWQEGAAARLEPITPSLVCSALAFNAFNYRICGLDGFKAVVRLARELPAWQLTYGHLPDAIDCLNELHAKALGPAPEAATVPPALAMPSMP